MNILKIIPPIFSLNLSFSITSVFSPSLFQVLLTFLPPSVPFSIPPFLHPFSIPPSLPLSLSALHPINFLLTSLSFHVSNISSLYIDATALRSVHSCKIIRYYHIHCQVITVLKSVNQFVNHFGDKCRIEHFEVSPVNESSAY